MGLVFGFLFVPSLSDFGNYFSCLSMLWNVLELPVPWKVDKVVSVKPSGLFFSYFGVEYTCLKRIFCLFFCVLPWKFWILF